MTRALLAMVVYGLMASISATTAAESFKDRLDLPAVSTPRSVMSNLTGIARAGNTYIAVGERGHILLSADKGKSWTQSPVPLSSPLTAVNFPTPQKGWAVGHDGVILHSEDGGKHWVRQLDGRKVGEIMVDFYEKQPQNGDPKLVQALNEAHRFKQEGANKPFLDVYFENEQSGWVIGSFNLILKTADGGKTWAPWLDRTENPEGYSLHAMASVDGEVFIVGELGLILRLDRQQNRFVAINSTYKGSLFGVTGKPGVVLIYGLRGNLFRSRDKGKSWQPLKQGTEAALVGGGYLDDGRLVLVSNAGHVLVSNDDGDSFVQAPIAKTGMLGAVAPLDGDAVLVVGIRGVRTQRLK